MHSASVGSLIIMDSQAVAAILLLAATAYCLKKRRRDDERDVEERSFDVWRWRSPFDVTATHLEVGGVCFDPSLEMVCDSAQLFTFKLVMEMHANVVWFDWAMENPYQCRPRAETETKSFFFFKFLHILKSFNIQNIKKCWQSLPDNQRRFICEEAEGNWGWSRLPDCWGIWAGG